MCVYLLLYSFLSFFFSIKAGKFTEGNGVLAYHSLSEGAMREQASHPADGTEPQPGI